jgi:hypothetical protein
LLLRLLGLVIVLLAGCAKPPDLPDVVVTASSSSEFTRFRADLGARFPAPRLKDFDVATQELELDALARQVASAADRETDMLRAINGQTIHAATVLGWTARRARFLREIAEITRMLDHDLKQAERTAAAGTPESITRRIGSEREVLAKLQANLADTERRLAELGSTPTHTK